MVERWGRYIILSAGDLGHAERVFRRFGGPAISVGRQVPVIRIFIALPAGIVGIPQLPFQLYNYAGFGLDATVSLMGG